MRKPTIALAVLATVIAWATPSYAKVIKLEVLSVQSPAFDGRVFGSVGTYDRVLARATVAVSPTDRHNTIIVDIDRAPRNPDGLVEATADVEILRPTVAANGNRRLLYDVVNRGVQRAISMFNDASTWNNPPKAGDGGNGFLMNRGYTVVFSGWQGELPADGRMKTISVPVVAGVTGLSREEFIFDHTKNPTVETLTYPIADLDPAAAKLTIRQYEGDARATPADLTFQFEAPDRISISRPAGFDAGAIYELIYTAKDPKVMGLGFAATRDIVTFLRREAGDAAAPNPVAGRIDHAIAFGQSQSGRFVHDFLYLGFNEDEAGRPVFDGLMPHIAGGKVMFTNYRFAQPGRNVQQHGDRLYPGAQFPFTYPVTTDAVTGKTDGWLSRCLAAGHCPKIMQTDTQLEFYQSLGSLVTTDTKGEHIDMPDNVRLYQLASLQHAALYGSKSAPLANCTYPSNPLYAGPVLRALLVALDGWIGGVAPPASRYPSRRDGTLVEAAADKVGFPKVPGFDFKATMTRPTVVDHAVMPPAKAAGYPVFLPKIDADGNDIAGIRLPTLVAPIGTHVGWNIRKAGFANGALCGNFGSLLPFSKTRDERLAVNDPRLSLAERYPAQGDRAASITKATRQLVLDRLLLDDDAKQFEHAAN
jgi:hypothetical protein